MEVQSIIDCIRKGAEKHPERAAVLTDAYCLSYRDLEARTNQVAWCLLARGVKAGSRVGLVLPRGVDTIVTIVGILKAGATYVPMASESPISRVQDCFETAQPALAIVEGGDVEKWRLECPVLSIEDLMRESFSHPEGPTNVPIDPKSLAYIIFTSGTTGRPKGVPIRHESLANFALGDQEACMRVEPSDKVLHCYSPASDGHIEEIWPTFLAGATLVVASDEQVHAGDALAELMNRHGVTIVSCAPTLLSMVPNDVPSLRRILFGAENLPQSLVARWWREGREIINTYGPTEATVGATYGHCFPGKPIHIGRPLPGYRCHILDEHNQESDRGELAISGIGVATGYLNNPEASEAKFITNPFATGDDDRILYRTGDLAAWDADGNIVWLGRLDAQVKIRGHRIELAEIESCILADPAVKAAAVTVRQEDEREPELVALIVPHREETLDLAGFLEGLKLALPPYMVPQSVEVIDRIPVLPSGKIDRSACQHLRGRSLRIEREIIPPSNDAEKLLIQIWRSIFHKDEISVTDDFFDDLGGYSLLASKFVSILRNDHGHRGLSVVDIYENPTIRSFATLLEREGATGKVHDLRSEFQQIPPNRYRRAKIFQGLGILVLYTYQALFWLGPIIAAIYASNEWGYSDFQALMLGLGVHAFSVPAMLATIVVSKWLVLGKAKEGSYPLWGAQFLRWWFVKRLMEEAPVAYLTGTPLAPLYLRLLGAKVGCNVTIDSLDLDSPDLIEIGDDACLERASWIMPSTVVNGMLVLKKIRIGSGCVLGVRSGLAGGASMEDGSVLSDLSCVQGEVSVPAYEEWAGVPAAKTEPSQMPAYNPRKRPRLSRLFWFGLVQVCLSILLTLLDALPFQLIAFTLYNLTDNWWEYPVLEPLFAVALVGVGCLQVLAVKWLVLGKMKPGTYPFPGQLWIRKWFTDKHLEVMGNILVPIYDSLFAGPWCRSLGMKCGPRCEIALPIRMPYDLVELGEESFIASQVSVGMPIRRNGRLVLERTQIGRRVFLGNDSVVPQNVNIPNDFLLGVLSACPDSARLGEEPNQAWLGSPAFRMPTRQVAADFDERQTYRPTKKMYAQRLAHESFRIVLPSLFSLIVFAIVIEGFVYVWNEKSLLWALALLGPIYFVGAIVGAGLCWVSKKALVGRYVPTIQPLWSKFVWKAETYSTVLHDFGVPMFIGPLVGSPYLTALMRFLGARVGKRAFINTTDWTETDLFTIGDDVAVNWNAPLQGHLFEDRVMKIGSIRIGDRVSVGTYSIILCDATVKDDVRIGHLSLVMKGETIPFNSQWIGSPAQEAAWLQ